jgi:putative solute:sodium symporter small subunit
MMTNDSTAASPSPYWRHARRLTLCLSAIWLIATFCVIFFARDLHQMSLFGWPLSFYMAAQGILLIYVFLVGVYAWRMHRLDQRYARKDHEQ